MSNFITQKYSKSAFGELLVAQLNPQFVGSFEYTISNTAVNNRLEVNGGTVTQASAMAVLTTSTTTASSAKLTSVHHAKYRAGLGGLIRFTALYTTGTAGTEQFIGLAGETGSSTAYENGFMIIIIVNIRDHDLKLLTLRVYSSVSNINHFYWQIEFFP